MDGTNWTAPSTPDSAAFGAALNEAGCIGMGNLDMWKDLSKAVDEALYWAKLNQAPLQAKHYKLIIRIMNCTVTTDLQEQ
jgi:hypothetical protein